MTTVMDDDDTVYLPVSPLVVQRDVVFEAYPTVVEAFRDTTFPFAADTPAMLISRRGEVSMLNFTGAFLWDALDGIRSVRALAELLSEVFAVEPHESVPTVRAFLKALYERQLITCATVLTLGS
jgi:hypothetical protein